MANTHDVIPVVILTKIDLIKNDELRNIEKKISDRLNNVDIISISVIEGVNCKKIKEEIRPNETIILMGSSGVGKSTLINFILENEEQKIQEIRNDDKGRHTTTNRKMFYLPNGSFIVDNPGIRAVSSVISKKLENECRFSNCGHTTEPGCKVLEKIKKGEMTQEGLKNMKKIERESEFYASRDNFKVMQSRKNKWKSLSKDIKNSKKKNAIF
jgi:ribosome biogenesis GTPase